MKERTEFLPSKGPRSILSPFGAMAEFERELIRERVKLGMKNANAKGTGISRPRAT